MAKLAVIALFITYYSIVGCFAQANETMSVEARGTVTSKNIVPFWLRANKFGDVPLSGISASTAVTFLRPFDTARKKLKWSMSFDGRAMISHHESKLLLIEALVKCRFSAFQLSVGREKGIVGYMGDSTLSSGSFTISGNALGIPGINFSIPEFYRIPVFKGLFSIKGNFVHGWVGTTELQTDSFVSKAQTYYHQSSVYFRLGRENWKLRLIGGFNHNVFWGSEREIFGPQFQLTPFKTWLYVSAGKTYGIDTGRTYLPSSKIGNQIGSIDFALEYDFKQFTTRLYRQFLYDKGGLSKLANVLDGLNGVAFIFKQHNKKKIEIQKLLFEVLYTKNQGGESWSPQTKSGDEDYYNNYVYWEGWSYRQMTLGTPFITRKEEAVSGLPSYYRDYFINNRLFLFHVAAQFQIGSFSATVKTSFSDNLGTWGTSSLGHNTGGSRRLPPTTSRFVNTKQLSQYFNVSKKIRNNWLAEIEIGLDKGKLLPNSAGVSIALRKYFQ
jgi:hypothetical protein